MRKLVRTSLASAKYYNTSVCKVFDELTVAIVHGLKLL